VYQETILYKHSDFSYIKIWKYGKLCGINLTNLFYNYIPDTVSFNKNYTYDYMLRMLDFLPSFIKKPSKEIGFTVTSSDNNVFGEAIISTSGYLSLYLINNTNYDEKLTKLSVSGNIVYLEE
jgi:hypothetical protein